MFGEIFICQFPFTSGTGSKIRPAPVLFDLQQDAVICRVTSASRTGTLDVTLNDWRGGSGLNSGEFFMDIKKIGCEAKFFSAKRTPGAGQKS